MKPLGDRMTFRLDNVTQPFEYRAIGGDDQSMPWQTLRVFMPPKVVDLAARVQPPAYTGKRSETGGKLLRVLAGSALVVNGKTDKPIKTATLRSETAGEKLPVVQIAEDGLSFSAPAQGAAPWRAEKTAIYWFEIVGEEDLPSGKDSRLDVQVSQDLPPGIAWDTPTDHAFVTPRALVPIKCLVKDDLAIRQVQLKYLRPDATDQGELVVSLYAGPPKARPLAKGEDRGGESRNIEKPLDLALIPGLTVGSVLAVRITASDYKPQEATTQVRRITIISDEELENRVTQKQTAILEQLAEVLKLQREARAQTAALEIQIKETGQLSAQELTQLEAAELNQRNVQRQMSSPEDGVEAQVVALLAELDSNRLADQAAARRMNELLSKVREINRQPLPAISQELTAAVKSARAALENAGSEKKCEDSAAEPSRSLGAAGKNQDDVVARLESLLGELSQWDNFSRLAREVSQIRVDEEKLTRDTEALQLKAAAATNPDAADNRVAARQLSQRQLEIARRFDKLQTRMEDLLTRLRVSDPLVAATLADALDAGRRFAIGGQMRSVAGELGEQRLGQAGQTQEQILANLKDLVDLLASRRDRELARGVKSLGETASELNALSERHQQLHDELNTAAKEKSNEEKKRKLERLAPELKKLAEEVAELSRKLERLRARRAAEAGTQAGISLDQAGAAAEGGDADDAQQQSQKAKDLLDEARQELEQQIKQVQQDLQREELARMEQLIQGLVTRQKGVLKEIGRLEGLRDKKTGQLTRSQQASLKQTAEEQRSLAEETAQLGQTLASAKAFVLTLDAAQREMLLAAAAMDKGETGPAAVKSASAALARLEQILAALKPDEGSPLEPQDPPEGDGGQNQGNQPTLQNLAELKLLKLMQETINRRTAELEEARRKTGQLTEEQDREVESLAQEQGQLADRVLEMIQAAAERPEDDLGNLPIPGDRRPGDGDNKKGGAKPDPAKKNPLEDDLLRELEKGK
jgi:archaellum component FlaC